MYEGDIQDTSKINCPKNLAVVTRVLNKVIRDKNDASHISDEIHLS